MRNRNRRMTAALLTVLLLLLSGCMDSLKGSKVVLTTGFEKNEVFRIEDMSCTLPEAMVYLVNTKNRYESVYGREIWNVSLDGVTLEENIKETVLAQLAQQKTMNLLARQNGVALSEEEEARAMQAAETYFQSLSEEEKSALQITVKDVEELYREYALARKVYQYIIKDINPEISDDEARTITVQYIYFRTCVLDGTGRKIEYSEEEKQETEEEKDTSTEKLKGDRILLVEDNEINIYVAQIILEKAGCIVTVARNGEEAVKLFQESDIYQFDAILMDVRMPIMNGLDATRAIRRMDRPDAPEVPIIAMTADAFDEERRNTLEAGMDYHLSKPINPSILYKVLAEYIQ